MERHLGKSCRDLLREVEILLQTVEIFTMNRRDFHVERSRFS